MNRWTKTIVAIGTVTVATAISLPAQAHKDYHKDPTSSRCDTRYRKGHESKKKSKDSHEHKSSNDAHAGPLSFHNHGGHYVLRSDYFYVEVVGGQGYSNSKGNQGGFVQGEVDLGNGTPDVDFYADSFAGQNSPNANGTACASVGDTKREFRR